MRHIRKLGSLVLSAAAGVGVGILTGKLFVPLIQMGYFSTDQVLPLPIIRDTGDDLRLGNHLGRHHDRLYGDSGHSDFPDADCTDAEAGGGLSMGELLTARDVSKGFPLAGGETFWALKHINLSIPAGKLKKAKKRDDFSRNRLFLWNFLHFIRRGEAQQVDAGFQHPFG